MMLTQTQGLQLDEGTESKVLYVSTLSLSNFRNYAYSRLEVTPAPVVLTGRNGAGKTNILEAISLLTPGRGLRRARLSEIDSREQAGLPWAVAATINGREGEIKIGTGRDPESSDDNPDKRITKIDGKIVKGQTELARHFSMVWLTPQMEQLFQESASTARKFFDRLVYSFDAEHASRVNEYDYAMRERNRLLQMERADSTWLDALEQTMAETGAAIAQARILTSEHINHAIHQSALSFPKAHIHIEGFIERKLEAGQSAVDVEDEFKALLRQSRGQDRATGRTLSGTHRSEMQVTHIEKQMPAESCSTGEQKAMLLSIVLAQARSGARWHGITPVLLLDEVVAHLDATRRLELFDEICQIGAQAWMTGTDPATFAALGSRAQFFSVSNASLEPQL
jgi:DNA replication and repair protein RecF